MDGKNLTGSSAYILDSIAHPLIPISSCLKDNVLPKRIVDRYTLINLEAYYLLTYTCSSKYPRSINLVISVMNQQIKKNITHENPISVHRPACGHT